MSALAGLSALDIAVRVVVSAWMVGVSIWDHRGGRIPNAVTAPVFLGVGAFRVYEGVTGEPMRLFVLLAWVLVFLLWMANFIGGGDAKFLLALYALFPSMEFTAVLALILLVLMVPLVVWALLSHRSASGRASVRETLGAAWRRLATGKILPTRSDLEAHGKRYAWTYALPALVFTWVYW